MRYKPIVLNEYGKARVCPFCDNEEATLGNYCKICANEIVNRCAESSVLTQDSKYLVAKNCGAVLEGNARYCSYCGNEGTFFQRGWLKDWRSENIKKAILNVTTKDNAISFSEIKKDRLSAESNDAAR